MQDVNSADNFGSVVKAARQKKEMTQSQLAEKLSISTRYLKAIENSGRKPSYNLLSRIIQELGIPANAVFRSNDEDNKDHNHSISLWKVI